MATITIGGTDYEAYGDVAGGDIYFAARLGSSAWFNADTTEKARACVSATRWINRYAWQGSKTSSAQELEFPRTELFDKDGEEVDSDTIPQPVVDAQYELALVLIQEAARSDLALAGTTNTKRVKRVKAEGVEVEFMAASAAATRFPTAAHILLLPFMDVTSGALSGAAYGTDRESVFDDDGDHDFGITDPYA